MQMSGSAFIQNGIKEGVKLGRHLLLLWKASSHRRFKTNAIRHCLCEYEVEQTTYWSPRFRATGSATMNE